MKHTYDSPISLTHPFKVKKATSEISEPGEKVVLHRYVICQEKEPSCLIVSSKFLGATHKVDLYNLINENRLGRKIHEIKYIKKEEVSLETFRKMIKLNRYFFTAVLKIDPSQDDFSIFSTGEFKEELLSEDEIKKLSINREFSYFKNYIVLPVHLNFKTVPLEKIDGLCSLIIESYFYDLSEVKQQWKAIKEGKKEDQPNLNSPNTQLRLPNKKVFKSSKFSKIKSSVNFIYIENFGSLKERTFGEYLRALARLSCRFFADDRTPDDFVKIILKEKMKSYEFWNHKISDLIIDGSVNEIEENKFNFMHAISYLTMKFSLIKDKLNKDFALVCLLPTITSSIDHNFGENFQNIKSETNLFEDFVNQRLNLRRIYLIPVEDLNPTCLDSEMFQSYIRSVSLFVNFERSVIVKEFSMLHSLDFIPSRSLYAALQNSGCDIAVNYENLETIGDSAMKLIVTFFLYLSDDWTEGDMTLKRTEIICNENLERQAKKSDIAVFVRVHKRKAKNFVPPYFSILPDKINDLNSTNRNKLFLEQVIGGKVQADVIEAIIGAGFIKKYQLLESLVVLKEFKVISGYNFDDYQQFFTQSLLIDKEVYESFRKKKKKLEKSESNYKIFGLLRSRIRKPLSMTNSKAKNKSSLSFNLEYNIVIAMKNQSSNSSIAKNYENFENHYLEDFQRRHLRYRFSNVVLLKNALNHSSNEFQRLEFLGDAVIEIFALSNFYFIMRKLKKHITPEILHSLKLALLSTETLAKICRHFKIYRHFTALKPKDMENIRKYLKEYSKSQKFGELWFNSDIEAPKKMADGFEAVVGAVFLDGSWPAVKKFLSEVFCSFIYFFAIYNQTMMMDFKSAIINFFAKKGIKCEFVTKLKETSLVITRDGTSTSLYKASADTKKIAEIRVCNKFFNEKKWKEFNDTIIS
jgi:dsRNA-specific ribonuclease